MGLTIIEKEQNWNGSLIDLLQLHQLSKYMGGIKTNILLFSAIIFYH